MSDLPSAPRLERAAIERIIKRAAELQAAERDLSDGLSEKEMFQLGLDVGIPDGYLKQAMLEEQVRVDAPAERGIIGYLAGPRFVTAARPVAGETQRIELALHQWMAEGELLQVKRRFPQQTSWEAKQGAMASLKRALSMGGRSYALTQAREVVGQVTALDQGRCHVRLVADLQKTRVEHIGWSAALLGTGVAATIVATVIGVLGPITWIPVIVGGVASWATLRGHQGKVERVHVALEQVLDRLEHGEVEAQQQFKGGPRQSAFLRIADEVLKNIGPGKRDG